MLHLHAATVFNVYERETFDLARQCYSVTHYAEGTPSLDARVSFARLGLLVSRTRFGLCYTRH
jgi:hypothetical protein